MKRSLNFSNLVRAVRRWPAWVLPAGLAVVLGVIFLSRHMDIFSPDTEKKLRALDPGFAVKVRQWFSLCRSRLGIEMVIISGRRTPAEQNALHLLDKRNPAYNPKRPSSHIDGLAVDVNGWKDGKPVLLKASSPAAWAAAVALAKTCGLSWGGLFKGYYDGDHFYA